MYSQAIVSLIGASYALCDQVPWKRWAWEAERTFMGLLGYVAHDIEDIPYAWQRDMTTSVDTELQMAVTS